MTMTDHWNDTDHGAPGAAREPAPGAPRRRVRTDPQYTRSALSDPRFRKLIAGVLEGHIAELLNGPAGVGEQFVAEQLDEFVNELREI